MLHLFPAFTTWRSYTFDVGCAGEVLLLNLTSESRHVVKLHAHVLTPMRTNRRGNLKIMQMELSSFSSLEENHLVIYCSYCRYLIELFHYIIPGG